jgi:hypothetical protein
VGGRRERQAPAPGTVHAIASSTSRPLMMLVDDAEPGGEGGGDGAGVGEAGLAAGVCPHGSKCLRREEGTDRANAVLI